VMQVDYRPYGPLTREMIDRVLAEESLLPEGGPIEDGVAESSVELSGTRVFETGR
jgi:hypothetical protein